MSYPPVQYDAEGGEVTAAFRAVDSRPDIERANGAHTWYLATGESTHGEFGLYRWDMPATPNGPDPHFHRTVSESFYVLAGEVRLFDGDHWVNAVPGDFLYVPQGGIHAFRNESGAPASMLLLFTPGAPREEYFEVLADAARRAAMSEQDWADFFERHDTYWV